MTIFRHRAQGPGPAGDTWSWTMHSSGAGALADIHSAWNTLVEGMFAGAYGALLTVDQSVDQIVTDALDPVTGKNTAQARSAVTYKGARGATSITPQRSSIVFGLRTALPTRAGRGRMYWPGPAGDVLTASGSLASGDAAAICAQLAVALGTMAATTVPVIYHRASRTSTPITQVTVALVLGSQRRRTNKVSPAYESANV